MTPSRLPGCVIHVDRLARCGTATSLPTEADHTHGLRLYNQFDPPYPRGRSRRSPPVLAKLRQSPLSRGTCRLHRRHLAPPRRLRLASDGDPSDVYISGSYIHLPYDKAGEWPIGHYDSTSPDVVGNPWIFIRHQGQWYAATWEWMRPNQTFKYASAVAGDHIKQDPFWDWEPESGVWYGFMLSGMARNPVRNVEERSNVVMFQWP